MAARESVSDAEVRLAQVPAPNGTGDDLASVVELLEAVSAGDGGLAQVGDGGSLGDLIDAVLAGLMAQASEVAAFPPSAAPPVTSPGAVTLPAPVTSSVPVVLAPDAGKAETVISAGDVNAALGQTVAILLQGGVSGGEDSAEQTDESVLNDVAGLLASKLRDSARGVPPGPVMRTGQLG
ncbi:hypothetical protein OOK44_11625 [Streptomyces cellulosae]|uniref:hypothetical protein n=1 Tax=Streptomyces cellulosae TaxID=1968 RepID=UPI00225B5BFD|nr:hypothetical protein [Streptomyces cellulosae]WTC58076.1 hypothetical protein OH715_23700 [Streptomyces cellulosae]